MTMQLTLQMSHNCFQKTVTEIRGILHNNRRINPQVRYNKYKHICTYQEIKSHEARLTELKRSIDK